LESIQTNIVIADLVGSDSQTVVELLKENGILIVPTGPSQVRLVTHRNVTQKDIEKVVSVLRTVG